jgi:hypothetical protein
VRLGCLSSVCWPRILGLSGGQHFTIRTLGSIPGIWSQRADQGKQISPRLPPPSIATPCPQSSTTCVHTCHGTCSRGVVAVCCCARRPSRSLVHSNGQWLRGQRHLFNCCRDTTIVSQHDPISYASTDGYPNYQCAQPGNSITFRTNRRPVPERIQRAGRPFQSPQTSNRTTTPPPHSHASFPPGLSAPFASSLLLFWAACMFALRDSW